MTSKLVGYARVSTTDKDLSVQIAALEKAGCETIFQEKKTGTKTEGREELARLLEFLREGDTLVVMKVDRLGRSLLHLANILDGLQRRGIKFRTLDATYDVETASGRAMLQMLMIFAELENSFRKERQLAGIAAAKERGVYKKAQSPRVGVKTAVAKEYLRMGMGYREAAAKAGMSYRVLYKTAPEFKNQALSEKITREKRGLKAPAPVAPEPDTEAQRRKDVASSAAAAGFFKPVDPDKPAPKKGVLSKLFGR